jgi:hypothetical protein
MLFKIVLGDVLYIAFKNFLENFLFLYSCFRETYFSTEIDLKAFEAFKPWYVKQLWEFNSCSY